MPARPSKSNFGFYDVDLWPPDAQNWSFHALPPMDHSCQFASILLHLFWKYHVHKFVNRQTDGWTNGRTNRQVVHITAPASRDWKRHKQDPQNIPTGYFKVTSLHLYIPLIVCYFLLTVRKLTAKQMQTIILRRTRSEL